MGHVKALEMTSCKYLIRRIEVKVDIPYNSEYNLRFPSWVVTFGGNLSSVHVQCHKIDLVVFKIKRVFRNSPI
jgi:hypothetical protein